MRALAIVLLVAGACASSTSTGRPPPEQREDAAMACSEATRCPSGFVCVQSSCVPSDGDQDGDGVPTSRDCDDTDSNVGTTANRACNGACGAGTETCHEGAWGECACPSCTDGDRNGRETGADCGGPECDPCVNGEPCTMGRDCQSEFCSATGRCSLPACADGTQNGDETDTDCGGADCDPCQNGDSCRDASDCQSGYCRDGDHTCQSPSPPCGSASEVKSVEDGQVTCEDDSVVTGVSLVSAPTSGACHCVNSDAVGCGSVDLYETKCEMRDRLDLVPPCGNGGDPWHLSLIGGVRIEYQGQRYTVLVQARSQAGGFEVELCSW